jgi:beta-1,4-mannosyl-glycoprotein beta-1,4-N-acetylglucosaminyltransferase
MKIIDSTTYFEEDLMMDLRFNVLDSYVDEFIVSEAIFSHSGREKKINFNKKNFPKFEKKINHIIIDKEPGNIIKNKSLNSGDKRHNSIARIREQRNYISKFLEKYDPNDYIIYSDNDEIPNLKNIDFKKNKNEIMIFKQKIFYYKFNLILPETDWFGSKACKIKNLKSIDSLRNSKNKKYPFYRIDAFFSDIKHQSLEIIDEGGWHFSNLKNFEDLQKKYLNDENHSEYETLGLSMDRVKYNIENRSIDYDHKAKKDSPQKFTETKLQEVELELLPHYIQNNIEKYKDWIAK